MTVFTLKAKNDHLQKVASTRDYIKAISEFVWNALDADATAVSVEFLRKMEEKNGPVRQAFFQCGSTAYENYGTANSRIRLDWDKYHEEVNRCSAASSRVFVSLQGVSSAMIGIGGRTLGLVVWGFILIPLCLLWAVGWVLGKIVRWIAAGFLR